MRTRRASPARILRCSKHRSIGRGQMSVAPARGRVRVSQHLCRHAAPRTCSAVRPPLFRKTTLSATALPVMRSCARWTSENPPCAAGARTRVVGGGVTRVERLLQLLAGCAPAPRPGAAAAHTAGTRGGSPSPCQCVQRQLSWLGFVLAAWQLLHTSPPMHTCRAPPPATCHRSSRRAAGTAGSAHRRPAPSLRTDVSSCCDAVVRRPAAGCCRWLLQLAGL